MKLNKKNIPQLLTFVLIGIYCLHSGSCANTKGAPTGGPKDTIPPAVLSVIPDSNAMNVPRQKTKITITFNEYVQLKDASKNIVLSPPQNKRPVTKIKGKSIVVTFPEELDSAKTYSLNFGSAIADNNEGNILENFVYSFSTGNEIDSMLVSGTIVDFSTLLPVPDIKIALYENPSDSSVFNTLPTALAKSDKWGYFCVRNLKPKPYAIYAFKDENGNNKYDPGNELIGFSDSLYIPHTVMKKGLPQLTVYDMKDTLACLSRPSELDIYLFRENPSNQYVRNYGRPTARGAFIKFNAPDVIIDSFSIRGVRHDKIIKQFNSTFDSLSFWINEGGRMPDTLFLGIKYHKTDSSGMLVPTVENLRLIAPKEKKESGKKSGQKKDEKRKDLLDFKLEAAPDKVEQNGYVFEFTEPLVKAGFDTIQFTTSTPKKIVSTQAFTVKQDSADIRRYILRPAEPFKIGNDYQMIIPKAAFRDINGFTNDSTYNKLSLPTDDKLSSLTLEMKNVDTRYIVELVSEKRDKVFRKYIITDDITLKFPYLQKGSYSIRITEDENNNGLLDPGDIIKRKQPEKVLLYKLDNGKDVIEIKERFDLEQTIDIKELFGK